MNLEQPRTVWVALKKVRIPKLEALRTVAIQLNAPTWVEATEVDFFLTNASDLQLSAAWVAQTYSQRNWVEVFYRQINLYTLLRPALEAFRTESRISFCALIEYTHRRICREHRQVWLYLGEDRFKVPLKNLKQECNQISLTQTYAITRSEAISVPWQ